MTDHHSLLAGEWKLEAICGHVRGKLWWHVAARGKKNPKGTSLRAKTAKGHIDKEPP